MFFLILCDVKHQNIYQYLAELCRDTPSNVHIINIANRPINSIFKIVFLWVFFFSQVMSYDGSMQVLELYKIFSKQHQQLEIIYFPCAILLMKWYILMLKLKGSTDR